MKKIFVIMLIFLVGPLLYGCNNNCYFENNEIVIATVVGEDFKHNLTEKEIAQICKRFAKLTFSKRPYKNKDDLYSHYGTVILTLLITNTDKSIDKLYLTTKVIEGKKNYFIEKQSNLYFYICQISISQYLFLTSL